MRRWTNFWQAVLYLLWIKQIFLNQSPFNSCNERLSIFKFCDDVF